MNKRIKQVKGSYRIRRTWDIHPATRVKDSDKIYDRKSEKIKLQELEDYSMETNDDSY